MLISENTPYLRFYTTNSISTPYIEYQTIPKTINPNTSEFVDFDRWDTSDEGQSYNQLGGLNFEIKEHTFVTTYNPSYYDPNEPFRAWDPDIGDSLYDVDPGFVVPFVYLKVPIGDLPDTGAISSKDIEAASSFHALYVNATATFVSNSVGITDPDGNSILGHGIMFEHFGTRTSLLEGESTTNAFQRNTSEFVLLSELNKRAYYPTTPTTTAAGINQPYKVTENFTTVDNAIRWNKDDRCFECQLRYNDIINFAAANPIAVQGQPFPLTPPYSIIIKGTYLLM